MLSGADLGGPVVSKTYRGINSEAGSFSGDGGAEHDDDGLDGLIVICVGHGLRLLACRGSAVVHGGCSQDLKLWEAFCC